MQHPPPRIRELAQKWLQGDISAAELQEFNDWYNQFDDEKLILPADSDTPAVIKTRILQQLTARIQEEPSFSRPGPRRGVWYGLAAAACLGALVFLAGQHHHWWRPTVQQVSSGVAMQKIILPDSSIVWLKPNSHLQYPDPFPKDTRQVQLTGEALFEVTQRAHQPFVVSAGGYTAKVLGTSFNLRVLPAANGMELSVLTGKVAVAGGSKSQPEKTTVLSARQKLVADSSQYVVQAVVPREQSALEAGTQYNMNFHNISFPEVLRRLEEKFNISCQLEGTGLQYCSLTVDLTDQSLQQSLELIAATSNGRYQMQEGKVTWSGEGCK
ncbi:FecR family protein [Chitinophaga qingshengii]|uniref:FecR domain-containing protein n=1 Tax=Chitinophaga qingshengii TaxID=1569794 RepID=A0ABR7TV06_9BACT|nr:FecR family protein [Chitinophaga qingshengii]MBC9933224.1 FecR domain-containing protein [Chitinophaga qingshengii]